MSLDPAQVMQVRQMLAAQQKMSPAVGVCVGVGAAVVVGALVGVFMTRPNAVGLRQRNRNRNTKTNTRRVKLTADLNKMNIDRTKFRALEMEDEEGYPMEKVPGMQRSVNTPVYKPQSSKRNKYTPLEFDADALQLTSFRKNNRGSAPTLKPVLSTSQIKRGLNAAATGVYSARTQLAPPTRNDWQMPLLHGHINQQSTTGNSYRTKTLWEELA